MTLFLALELLALEDPVGANLKPVLNHQPVFGSGNLAVYALSCHLNPKNLHPV